MRIKNKEIRQRRHRKEQTIKAAARDTRAQYADKPASTATPKKATAKKPAAKKPAAKKTETAPE
jgi:hypothetical protein